MKGDKKIIDIGRFTEALEQAGGIVRGMRATAFAVNEEQAEGTSPEFGGRHGQNGPMESRDHSKMPASEMFRIWVCMIISRR